MHRRPTPNLDAHRIVQVSHHISVDISGRYIDDQESSYPMKYILRKAEIETRRFIYSYSISELLEIIQIDKYGIPRDETLYFEDQFRSYKIFDPQKINLNLVPKLRL